MNKKRKIEESNDDQIDLKIHKHIIKSYIINEIRPFLLNEIQTDEVCKKRKAFCK